MVEQIDNTSHLNISFEVSINCKMNYQQNRMCAAIVCILDGLDHPWILDDQRNVDPVTMRNRRDNFIIRLVKMRKSFWESIKLRKFAKV